MCYVPNLVCYARFGFHFFACIHAFDGRPESWPKFALFYTISMALDGIDGKLAHCLNQCSRYGAALDMISDRTSCATIYMVLATLYPEISPLFYICLVLDFGSHFLQFNSSALLKSDSHKRNIEQENIILRYYYSNILFFSMLCVCSEAATVGLVFQKRWPAYRDNVFCQVLNGFLCLNLTVKMFINIHQWQAAKKRFDEYQETQDSKKK